MWKISDGQLDAESGNSRVSIRTAIINVAGGRRYQVLPKDIDEAITLQSLKFSDWQQILSRSQCSLVQILLPADCTSRTQFQGFCLQNVILSRPINQAQGRSASKLSNGGQIRTLTTGSADKQTAIAISEGQFLLSLGLPETYANWKPGIEEIPIGANHMIAQIESGKTVCCYAVGPSAGDFISFHWRTLASDQNRLAPGPIFIAQNLRGTDLKKKLFETVVSTFDANLSSCSAFVPIRNLRSLVGLRRIGFQLSHYVYTLQGWGSLT